MNYLNDRAQRPQPSKRYPAIVGNALICSDGTAVGPLRLLDKLYVRCGIVTIFALERKYRQDQTQQGAA